MKDLSNEENRDFLFGLVHHAIRGVAGVAHHLLGDEESKKMAKDVTDELLKLSNLKDNKENRDFIFGLVHHAIRGVVGVAHHAIGAVRGVAHHLLGDEDKQDFSEDLAMEITNALIKDNSEKAKKDFIFGLVHHAIRGVAGVAHHAIGAVRGLGHAILGDEELDAMANEV